ncbi:hypothetical protein [Uliginosibacterium aquaticum]|uniref:Uncharacterized protein n=1 Tax=Uliginosibacterium aquaticum TaxID=2731212 RepID=A0ABX2IIG2_9RHOO|nr:hypothetical protein [Uliginosibacterium aquaticum]NSL56614.1 hypothetical protein [Uliginosibacterium aquaticum]
MTSISSVSAAFRDPVSSMPRAARTTEGPKAAAAPSAGASPAAATNVAAAGKTATSSAAAMIAPASPSPAEAGGGRTLGSVVDCKV